MFGVNTFDLVFLDHWKDRYLPDTKLLEVSWCRIERLVFLRRHAHLAFFNFSEVWPPEERHHLAGRQRHLPGNSRLPGVHSEQPSVWKPVLQISPGVHESRGRLREICLLGMKYVFLAAWNNKKEKNWKRKTVVTCFYSENGMRSDRSSSKLIIDRWAANWSQEIWSF